MPYLLKHDLKSHLYPEITEEISRADDEVVQEAINAAIAETRSYLSRFNLLAIFGDANTEPTYANEHLKNIVKDIACWQLLKRANPNVNLELFRTIYSDAIKYLEKVATGKVDPGYPYKADDPATPGFNENTTVQWSSNTKRTHHF